MAAPHRRGLLEDQYSPGRCDLLEIEGISLIVTHGIHCALPTRRLAVLTDKQLHHALLESFDLQEDLSYVEQPIKILDVAERVTRSRTIRSYKVQWSRHPESEATWEKEEDLKASYPHLFAAQA